MQGLKTERCVAAQDEGPLLDAGRAAAVLLRRAAHRRQQPPDRHAVRPRSFLGPGTSSFVAACSRYPGMVHGQGCAWRRTHVFHMDSPSAPATVGTLTTVRVPLA